MVLGMDANDDAGDGPVSNILASIGILEVVISNLKDKSEPATYARNTQRKPIDSIWTSPGLKVLRCGFLPFHDYYGFNSDHHLIWVEICNQTLYGHRLQKHNDAFFAAKEMIKTKVKLNFPDFEKPFHLYTDASDIQLGATLVQEGRPLGFYTRKLNNAQRSYTVGEKELLGIVEGMKAFNGIIRGQDLTVHTDHLNLLYNKLPCQRMIR